MYRRPLKGAASPVHFRLLARWIFHTFRTLLYISDIVDISRLFPPKMIRPTFRTFPTIVNVTMKVIQSPKTHFRTFPYTNSRLKTYS